MLLNCQRPLCHEFAELLRIQVLTTLDRVVAFLRRHFRRLVGPVLLHQRLPVRLGRLHDPQRGVQPPRPHHRVQQRVAVAVDLAGEPDPVGRGALVVGAVVARVVQVAPDERGPDLEPVEPGARVPQQRHGGQVGARVRARVGPVVHGDAAQARHRLRAEAHEEGHEREAVLGHEALPAVQHGRGLGVDLLGDGQQGGRQAVVAVGVPGAFAFPRPDAGAGTPALVGREGRAVLSDAAVGLALGFEVHAAARVCQGQGVDGVPQFRREGLEGEGFLLLLGFGFGDSLAFLEALLVQARGICQLTDWKLG
ncbi:hypothetical protein PG989_000940 [Apiospora arundinis]